VLQILLFLRRDHRLGDALLPVLRQALGYTLKPPRQNHYRQPHC
jgi:hypothetical protein